MANVEKNNYIAVRERTKDKITEISKERKIFKYEIIKLLVDKEYMRFKKGK